MPPLSLTAIILTFNEELHIERAIDSVAALAERVVVVDSFSTDRTVEIARGLGAEVVQRPFINQGEQFQWALDTLETSSDWILRLDADEYLEPDLADEIEARLPSLPAKITGVEMPRKVLFQGQWIRHGGYYPLHFLRMWRTGAGHIEQRWMDEHAVLLRGTSVRFRGNFVDENLKDITWWTDKHNRFTTRQMVDFINLEHPLFPRDQTMVNDCNGQARWKRFLRNAVYGRAPLYLRAVLYFFQRYILKLGFLDGWKGFVFHVLQGFWNMMLIDVKIGEARTFITDHGVEAFKAHLRSRHGIDVNG